MSPTGLLPETRPSLLRQRNKVLYLAPCYGSIGLDKNSYMADNASHMKIIHI